MKRAVAVVGFCSVLAACARGPVAIERGTACASCRMTITSPRLAAEIVAPGEEPRFYDDIGCLVEGINRGHLREMGEGATAYVADHRSGAWIRAADALYTRSDSIQTPMGSHLIAHADAPSRNADRDAVGGVEIPRSRVFSSTARETVHDK